MQVLELLATFPGALTLADVSSLLDLPKTSAHRLLKGLVRAGLAKDNVGRPRLSARRPAAAAIACNC
ncbi:helix-turn-helix domain-containing protein [Bradyrhizobium sp. CCBAU 11434]|uniref:helix-turn-helix domain-containing protein n=1 Tax=Bradyrhizobium sp. CCBAU 11434 TaxID=1630885 RepID=UPI003FA4A639